VFGSDRKRPEGFAAHLRIGIFCTSARPLNKVVARYRAYYDDVSGLYWLLFIQPTFIPIILSHLTHADLFISHDCILCS